MKSKSKKKGKSISKEKTTENKAVKPKMKIESELKEKCFLYYCKGLTVKEVAKLFDLSFRTVQNWQTSEKWTEKQNPNSLKVKCYEMHTDKGMTYKEIAKILNLSVATVYRYVKEAKTHKSGNNGTE